MHYKILAVLSEPPQNRAELTEALELVLEDYQGIKWDWYQVGGRWTGTLDGYDPETDPKNASNNTRYPVKWPTEWADHAGDVQPVHALTADTLASFYAVVSEYGWHGGEDYIPWNDDEHKFVRREMPPLEWILTTFATGVIVVVDCHN